MVQVRAERYMVYDDTASVLDTVTLIRKLGGGVQVRAERYRVYDDTASVLDTVKLIRELGGGGVSTNL